MAKIDTTHKSGSLEVPGYQIATPVITLTATVDGLGHAILQDKMVAEDPTNGDPFNGDGGTVVQLVDVPAGALRLVAEIAKSSAGDVDLYVGTGSTPSVATEACVSATGAVLEYCNIDNPEPGPYWILAQNWAASTPGGEDQILLSTGVVVPGDMGNLTVSGPTSVPAAIPFSITLNWNEPALAGEDRWYGAVTLGTSPASPTDIGTTDVDLAYHQPASLANTAPAVATTGEVIPYTLVLNGLTGNLLGSATITDVLPTGVSFAGNLTSTYGTASYDAGANMVEWSNGLKKDQSGSSQVPASTTPSHPVKLSVESVPAAKSDAVAPAAPAGAVSLALDDGVAENSIGVNDAATSWDFIWFNRFSPASADFPFKMNQVEVFFPSSGNVNVGDAILLALYENKSGSDPSVGTTLKATFPETVQTLGAWNTYTLPSSVAFTGPGDVLVGVIAVQNPPNLYYPASIDTTSSQGRSWIGWWNDVPPTPPTLPSDAVFATIDDLGLPGNWLVRASGETFTVPSVITVTFDVTVTAEGPASVVNTAHLSYDGDQFQAEATTNVVAATLPVTFVYHDLENVVPVGTDVLLSGDFNSWAAYTMTANADYSVFTATLPVEPGTYGYKYRVPGVCGNEYDCLNTTNRRVDAAGEMTVNDYRKVDVGYAHLIGPAAITITVGSPSGVISGDVYIQGVTNPDGMGNYKAQLGYGTGTDLSTWTWVDMTYSTQNGNNDVLTAEVTPAAAGTYRYAVRFNGNWGATNPNSLWAYGDLDGDYPGHDFNIDRTGVLTVLSEPVMFNLYLPVVMKDFPIP